MGSSVVGRHNLGHVCQWGGGDLRAEDVEVELRGVSEELLNGEAGGLQLRTSHLQEGVKPGLLKSSVCETLPPQNRELSTALAKQC